MPTCPDCGSIVMEGDPYCENCGALLEWDDDDEDEYDSQITYRKPAYFLDYGQTSETYLNPDDEKLLDITGPVCANAGQHLHLYTKIKEYMKAPDFNGFYIQKHYEFEIYYFHFIQENEYVKTTHVMTFVQDENYSSPERIFYEEYSKHNHDKLLENPRFKKLIESTGFEFSGCGGGYEACLTNPVGDVELTGEINMRVYFYVNNKQRQYKLDLDNMRLSTEYNEYDL